MSKQTVVTNSAQETKALGASVAKNLGGVNVIALHGELGSGKTTLAQGLAAALGIAKKIISPTFIIVRSYELESQKLKLKSQKHSPHSSYGEAGNSKVKSFERKTFFHIDLYRISDQRDLEGLGIEEIINNPENIVVIEWAEKMGELLSEKKVDISFEYVDEKKRKITIK
ncbi:MAG: tRNA (adenosine(37)-N6)-threonylcarbamoyltransferase complex ATPase subunit type 1 TsaE [Candidatus Levybacteria bacterium]|nr:tRNA (adenosine(37)-N6)-threonylcarbamoyltransferase complex ATPase subunit type 1 TsaE [Candidatus Levybacteria bacterium]